MANLVTEWRDRLPQQLQTVQVHEIQIVFGAFLAALIPFISRNKTDVSTGFPGDAGIYGYLAQDFPGRLAEGVNGFYVGRSFPSWVLYHIVQLFDRDPSYKTILLAFGLWNVVMITLAGIAWCLIVRELRIDRAGAWLGFIGLFLNHPILKTSGSSPILTDFTASTLSLFLFYAYLKRRLIIQFLITACITFTWPAGIYMGASLILLPRSRDVETQALISVKPPPYKLHYLLAALPTIAAFIYMQELLPGDLDYLGRGVPLARVGYLSIAIATSYLFFGLSELLRNRQFYNVSLWLDYARLWQFWTKLAVLLLLFKLPSLLATAGGNPMTLGHILYLVVLMSILQPGVFWVAHIVYFGPVLILALFCWRPICQWLHHYGPGLTLWACLLFTFSLDSESRHLSDFYPVLMPFIILATTKLRAAWQPWHYYFLAGVAFFWSKWWLVFPGSEVSAQREFPSQLYYLNHGPWMSNLMYAIQAALVVFLMYVVYDLYLRNFRAISPPTSSTGEDH